MIDIQVEDLSVVLVNIYAPNEDSSSFFENVFQLANTIDNPHKLYGGDFNVVRNPIMDRVGASEFHKPQASAVIDKYVEEDDLIDYWRYLNPETKRYTWLRKNPSFAGSRLDYWLVSSPLVQHCGDTDIPATFIGDHAPITIQIKTTLNQRGKGAWKFNNALLEDEKYVEMVNSLIDEIMVQHPGEDPRLIWEAIKLCVRGDTIKYATSKKLMQQNKLEVLEKKLKTVESSLVEEEGVFNNLNEKWSQIFLIKEDLNKIYEEKTRGAMIRSKATFYEYGEKMSKYFFQLEKHNFSRKAIHKIRDRDGSLVTHAKTILQHQKDFYKDLYAQRDIELSPLPFVIHKMLTNEENEKSNEPLKIQELDLSVSQMTCGKTPGPDGFSVDFYNKFWNKLRTPLFEAMRVGLEQQKLHHTAYQGIIVLLPKKGRDLLLFKNWRPITMLNNDYKILSKALANRMLKVMDHIISEEQSGFMKGRFIGDNILTLQTVIDYLHHTGQEALLLAIDIQRAFDEVQHQAIWAILDYFNFGYKFVEYVQTLYKYSSCAVTNNGWISDYFRTFSGVKQGDSISSFLFLCVIEVLSIMLKENTLIDTVLVNGIKKLLGMYADDVWNVIKNSPESLKQLMEMYKYFESCTGLKINYDKTEVMRIGALGPCDARVYTLFPLKWTDGPVKILGIDIYNSTQETGDKNYDIFCDKFKSKLSSWQNRGLTLLGKILVINTLLISQVVYKMLMVTTMTNERYLTLKNTIVNFLWDHRRPKIAYSKLILSYKDGGLKLHDLKIKDKSLKLSWVPKMLADTEWSQYIQGFVEIPLRLLFSANISPRNVSKLSISSPVIKQIIQYWSEINYKPPQDKYQVLDQVIWYNSCAKTSGWIFYKHLYDAGIVKVSHIYSEDQKRFYNSNELYQMFNVHVNFMEMYVLIQTIPYVWKTYLRTGDNATSLSESWYEIALKGNKISKEIYWYIVNNKAPEIQGAMLLWSQDLNMTFEDGEWSRICQLPWKVTLSTKLRLFQYKITQRCLVTNIHLFHYKIKDSKNCTFCKKYPETIVHLFWECDKVRHFWRSILDILKYQFNDNSLTLATSDIKKKILLNRVTSKPIECINMFVLVAKRYIYVTRCELGVLNPHAFVSQLLNYKEIEKFIAIKNRKLEQHQTKWAKYSITG